MESLFNERMNDYIKSMNRNKYIFEVSKPCGWGYFHTIFKEMTFSDMYREIELETGAHITNLYVMVDGRMKISISRDTVALQDFIGENPLWFQPIYSLPFPVVYRIFMDDDEGEHVH